eukprot:3734430-Lingulodinium_polyedra.AAC.1
MARGERRRHDDRVEDLQDAGRCKLGRRHVPVAAQNPWAPEATDLLSQPAKDGLVGLGQALGVLQPYGSKVHPALADASHPCEAHP